MPPGSSESIGSSPVGEVESIQRILSVDGMTCNNCAAAVEKALLKVPGVRKASVSFAVAEARVAFDPNRVRVEVLTEAVDSAGYGARLRGRGRAGEDAERAAFERAAANDRRRRMSVGIGLSAFIMFLAMGPARFGWLDFPGRLPLIAVAAAIVQFYVGGEYYRGAFAAARLRTTNMDTLVALGSSVAFFYSLAVLCLRLDPVAFPVYFESAAMIVTLVMVGKFLEARGRVNAGSAVRALLAGQPDLARVARGDDLVEVSVSTVSMGDIVVMQPGEKFPLDGRIVSGRGRVDEAMLTGESKPREKTIGDAVYAGTINQTGALRFEVLAEETETTLATMVELVRDAQATQAPIAKLADRVAAYFVPAILVLATLVGIYWVSIGSAVYFPEWHPISTGLVFAAATLLISCPCALGLATPLALIAGTGAAAQRGLLFKNATALENAAGLSTIVFDKTGTLTLGEQTVERVTTLRGDLSEQDWLPLVAALEAASEHSLGRAIVRFAAERNSARTPCEAFEAIPGQGVRGTVQGKSLIIGSRKFLTEAGIPFEEPAGNTDLTSSENHRRIGREEEDEGFTVVFVAIEGQPTAMIAIGDALRPSSKDALAELEALGLSLRMLSGDTQPTAAAIAHRLGLAPNAVDAGVLPAEKSAQILALREAGECVAMVGDGINDAPALAAADVGIAVGSGTDVALEAADIVLIESDLSRVAEAIRLSRQTMRTIRQNLFWAFAYNLAAIPLAAGALVPVLGPSARLGPGIAAGAMALSSLFVVLNSLRLRRATGLPDSSILPA